LWQSHMILSHAPPCSCKSKEKEKEKKRNINNDLAVLPSHDNSFVPTIISVLDTSIQFPFVSFYHHRK